MKVIKCLLLCFVFGTQLAQAQLTTRTRNSIIGHTASIGWIIKSNENFSFEAGLQRIQGKSRRNIAPLGSSKFYIDPLRTWESFGTYANFTYFYKGQSKRFSPFLTAQLSQSYAFFLGDMINTIDLKSMKYARMFTLETQVGIGYQWRVIKGMYIQGTLYTGNAMMQTPGYNFLNRTTSAPYTKWNFGSQLGCVINFSDITKK